MMLSGTAAAEPRAPMKLSTEQDYQERIVRTLVYIQGHLDDELDLESVAAVAAFSHFHFHRIFRAMVGEPVHEHIRRLRLERAAQRLNRNERSVTEAAFEAGFETHEAFTRAFKSMFGMPPSEYRANGVVGCRPPEEGTPPPEVEVRDNSPVRVVFIRHIGPYSEVGAAWGRLMAWAGPRGLFGPGMRMLGVVHDDPGITPPDKIRYDACMVVTRPVQPEGEVGVMELAGGKYAKILHKGPYEKLNDTYQKIYGVWLPKSGYAVRDVPGFEEYLNSPMNARPEDLLTAIYVPVE